MYFKWSQFLRYLAYILTNKIEPSSILAELRSSKRLNAVQCSGIDGRTGADRIRRDDDPLFPSGQPAQQTRATLSTSISAANARIHGDYLPTFAVASIAVVNAVAVRPVGAAGAAAVRPTTARPSATGRYISSVDAVSGQQSWLGWIVATSRWAGDAGWWPPIDPQKWPSSSSVVVVRFMRLHPNHIIPGRSTSLPVAPYHSRSLCTSSHIQPRASEQVAGNNPFKNYRTVTIYLTLAIDHPGKLALYPWSRSTCKLMSGWRKEITAAPWVHVVLRWLFFFFTPLYCEQIRRTIRELSIQQPLYKLPHLLI